jgi:hypothetical protein
MKICTFFGHRDAPMTLYPEMLSLVTRLVTEHGVTDFYCGARGNFDAMGASAVLAVKGQFPNVRLYEVLAYLPTTSAVPAVRRYDGTLYPEGLETVPKRFAISHRNRWMADRADYILAYVTTSTGGARAALDYALRHGHAVIFDLAASANQS